MSKRRQLPLLPDGACAVKAAKDAVDRDGQTRTWRKNYDSLRNDDGPFGSAPGPLNQVRHDMLETVCRLARAGETTAAHHVLSHLDTFDEAVRRLREKRRL